MESGARETSSARVRAQQQGQENHGKARQTKPDPRFGSRLLLGKLLAVRAQSLPLPGFFRPESNFPRLGHRLFSERWHGRGSETQGHHSRNLDDPVQAGDRRFDPSRVQNCLAHGHEVQNRVLRIDVQKGW